MITIIKDGTVVTMDDKNNIYKKKDIVVKDSKIFDIVDNYTGPYDKIIFANQKIVMPGLINTHAHLGMAYFRAINDTENFDGWWQNKILPIEKNFTEEDVYLSTLYSCIEAIKTGTTTVCDMYFQEKGIIEAVKKAKIRGMLPLYFIGEYDEKYYKTREELYLINKNSSLLNFHVSMHSFYTCSDELIKKGKELADKYGLLYATHFCEHSSELNIIENKYHLKPMEVLKKFNLLENKLLLAHSTFITDEELKMLSSANVTLNHNPVSNLNLGCGIADIPKYLSYNLNISLGTDGQGSGNNMNMFYHMSLVDLLQKGIYKKANILSSLDVLKMATINGAKALGLEKEIGSIEIGKKADLIILDLNNIEAFPYRDLYVELVHNVESNNIDTTMINGEILMQNHQLLLDIDENLLKKKISEINKN